MAGRSTGQHMLPQPPSKQTATAPPLNLCRSQAPLGNASREALLRIPAPAIAPGTNTAPAARRACLSIGIPSGFFHKLSRGGMRGWPVHRPTHAPATAPSPTAKESPKPKPPRAVSPEPVKESPSDIGATSKEKNNIVIPEFSAWLTLVLERCRAENIRNLPRQRAPTPLFPERRPREACSMPISGRHDLPLAIFNLPSRNGPSPTAKESPPHRHSGISAARRAGLPIEVPGGFFHTLGNDGANFFVY